MYNKLKVQYINPIIDAVLSVGGNYFTQEINRGAPFVKSKTQHFDDLVINIGITGDIKGQCLLSFSEDTIKKIAGAMMGGMEIDEIDDMVKSAISEFGNMIMGNAATYFVELNKEINISSPVIIEGNINVSSEYKFLGLPFWLDTENCFELYLAAKEV